MLILSPTAYSLIKMAYHGMKCKICSYKQPSPDRPVPVYHRHNSAKQVRILQGVEYERDNLDYFCPTCQVFHKTRMPYGLNICLSTSELHDFHLPREEGVVCPKDTSHVDWVTIPGGTIADLKLAWLLDYHSEWRPMRVLLVGGLNDLLKGGDFEFVKTEIKRLGDNISYQNRYHPGLTNEFSVATLLNPPKMVWFPDNGPPPPGHKDRQQDLVQLNEWISTYNSRNDRLCVPRFHNLGTRTTTKRVNGTQQVFKTHRWNEWRQSEPRHDMLHLGDQMRVKMGKQILKFFEGENGRHGHINYG